LLTVLLAGVSGAVPLAAQRPVTAPGTATPASTPSAATAPAAVDHQRLLRDQLVARIESRLAAVDGVVGFWLKDLTDGWSWGRNADRVFPTASSIKLAILAEMGRQVEAGQLPLDQRIRLQAKDRVGGSGILQYMGDGSVELSLADLSVFMIQMSDNTATNVLIDKVGMAEVNSFMDRIGLPNTRLRRKMIRPSDQAAGRENVSTPRELGRLVEMFHAGTLASAEGSKEMLELLAIPKGGIIRSGVPSEVRVAHKDGGLPGVVVDAGVVLLDGRPYVVSVMATLLADAQTTAVFTEVVRLIHDHMARLERANHFGAALPPGFHRDR